VEFDVVDVSDWLVVGQESEGADPKQWLARRSDDMELWLYKPSKFGLETSYRRYDDVAERLASALAEDLGVPAARVEFAARGTDEGIISLNVRPAVWELHSGDVRLSECPDYVSCSGDRRWLTLLLSPSSRVECRRGTGWNEWRSTTWHALTICWTRRGTR
jgi:hypothetical protein